MVAVADHPLITHIEPVDPELLEGDLIQPGHALFGVIWINRKRVSGEPCFYASRVPIRALFDYLAAGESVNEFLYDFEGVTREQADVVLQLAGSGLLGSLPKP